MSIVPPRRRLAISVALGFVSGAIAFWKAAQVPDTPRDFTLVWYAARAVLQGQNPYPLIGPGRELEWVAGLFYPLPGVFLGVPFTPFPAPIACALFMWIGAGCFAWALMKHGYGPLLAFGAAGFLNTSEVVQWSPLFAAATVLTPLSVAWIIKPQIGAAMFLVRPNWWAVWGAIVLTALAFLVQPGWIADWRDGLAEAHLSTGKGWQYLSPVRLPGGFLTVLCLLRWRRPEARLVFALACAPQAMLPYDTVPLFLVPRTWKEAALLTMCSSLHLAYVQAGQPYPSPDVWLLTSGKAYTILMYIPATIMVLRRPNEGTIPAWLERWILTWPAWLRGSPSRADA